MAELSPTNVVADQLDGPWWPFNAQENRRIAAGAVALTAFFSLFTPAKSPGAADIVQERIAQSDGCLHRTPYDSSKGAQAPTLIDGPDGQRVVQIIPADNNPDEQLLLKPVGNGFIGISSDPAGLNYSASVLRQLHCNLELERSNDQSLNT